MVFPAMDGEQLSASPLSTSPYAPLSPSSPSYFVSVAGSRRAATGPPSLEPLSFAKVPISPPPSGSARSASASTDCESAFSDAGADLLSRSPSLLTSLIQSQARRSARTTPATTPGVSPTATPMLLPGTTRCGRPILRRCSSGAATSDDGSRHVSLTALPEKELEQSLHRRRSCLKFAVTPRPLQLPSSVASSSRRASAGSSRRASAGSSRLTSPRCATPALDEDDEDDDEVAMPAFDSDDAGYQEDSEDGFTSDEDDVPTLIPRPGQWPPAWGGAMGMNPALTLAPAPILSTAARRAAAALPLPEPSTDDCEVVMPPRRARIRIREEEKSARKCTRHRSPPPVSRLTLSAELERAPPAARSPSAMDLCRRRSGAAPTPPLGRGTDTPARPLAGARVGRGHPRMAQRRLCASRTARRHVCAPAKRERARARLPRQV